MTQIFVAVFRDIYSIERDNSDYLPKKIRAVK